MGSRQAPLMGSEPRELPPRNASRLQRLIPLVSLGCSTSCFIPGNTCQALWERRGSAQQSGRRSLCRSLLGLDNHPLGLWEPMESGQHPARCPAVLLPLFRHQQNGKNSRSYFMVNITSLICQPLFRNDTMYTFNASY